MKPPCGVVTLTTDFGLEDSYVGTMKGVALRIFPEIRVVDITHQVTTQDVLEASLVLESAYPFFPIGSVHMAVVDPGVGTNRRPILVVSEEHYFVGPDNGTFTRVLNGNIDAVYAIENPQLMLADISHTFHGRDVFAPAAAFVARGVAPEEFGPEIDDPVRVHLPGPKSYPDQIIGEVLYIDSFGNVITNITEDIFKRIAGNQPVRVQVNGKSIDGIKRSYSTDVPSGLIALFGSSGLLEIAVAGGRADRRIGTGKGDTVLIDILGEGERRETGFDF